jgi:hypothetical protein
VRQKLEGVGSEGRGIETAAEQIRLKVQRAFDILYRLAFRGVRVNHGRPDIGMAQQLLDRPDVIVGFQQMGGKAVAERVRRDPLETFALGTGALIAR